MSRKSLLHSRGTAILSTANGKLVIVVKQDRYSRREAAKRARGKKKEHIKYKALSSNVSRESLLHSRRTARRKCNRQLKSLQARDILYSCREAAKRARGKKKEHIKRLEGEVVDLKAKILKIQEAYIRLMESHLR